MSDRENSESESKSNSCCEDIHDAVFNDCYDCVNNFIDWQLDDWHPIYGSALSLAIHEHADDIAELLLDNDIDLELTNANGYTALMEAALQNNYRIAKLILEKDADLESKNKNGETALFLAAGSAHAPLLKLLLKKRADVNTLAIDTTPLMEALRFGNIENAEILLKFKADINIQDIYGRTVLILGSINRQKQVLEFLLKYL